MSPPAGQQSDEPVHEHGEDEHGDRAPDTFRQARLQGVRRFSGSFIHEQWFDARRPSSCRTWLVALTRGVQKRQVEQGPPTSGLLVRPGADCGPDAAGDTDGVAVTLQVADHPHGLGER